MAFKDDEILNPLITKDWDSQAILDEDWGNQAMDEEIISDDDWDSETGEGLTIEDLFSQFNFTTADEPQDSMEEENSLTLVQKATKQFEQENSIFQDSELPPPHKQELPLIIIVGINDHVL